MQKNTLILYNQAAGSAYSPEHWLGRLIFKLTTVGQQCVRVVSVNATFSSSDALELIEDGCDLVLAAGGDGTVRLALEAARRFEEKGGVIDVGIVPVGTGNQLARNLSLYDDNFLIDPVDRAIDCILTGQPVRIDLGVMNGHYFAVAAGVGPMSDAIVSPDPKDKANWRLLAYASSLVQTIAQVPVLFHVHADGDSFQIGASGIFVSNIADLGLGSFSQSASLIDGLLDLCILAPREFQDYLEMGFRFAGGSGGDQSSPYYVRQVRQVDIEVLPISHQSSVLERTWRNMKKRFGIDEPTPLAMHSEVAAMIDGDPCGDTPMHIEVIPQAVSVLAPHDFSMALPILAKS